MSKLLREPLVHFILLGALVFAANTFLRGEPRDEDIYVSVAEIERMAAIMAAEKKRLPDEQEIAGLVASHVREEALYREALRLGLNDGDTIIRRRLAQKMQFMVNDLADPDLPSDAELKAWFQARAEQFAEPETRSFTHVYFSPDSRTSTLEGDAAAGLAALQAGADWKQTGDPFMLQRQYGGLSESDTAKLFGNTFAAAVFALEGEGWQGPVGSAFGLHLLRIDSRTDGTSPDFTAVRSKVAAAWMEEARRRANEQRILDIIAKYNIEIEGLDQ